MRIPTSKVYRAFPELDHFSDEQCRGFVRAEATSSGRRVSRWILQILAAAGGAFLCGVLSSRLIGSIADHNELLWRRMDFYLLVMGGGMLCSLLGAAVPWLFVKDFLLRRAVRRVISERGSCGACGYGLTGLPVAVDGKGTCPECGMRFQADLSLGEVQSDEAGERRFMPSPNAAVFRRPWLTFERRRSLRRILIAAGVLFVLFVLLPAGVYEAFLRVQASRARRDQLAWASTAPWSAVSGPSTPAEMAFQRAVRLIDAANAGSPLSPQDLGLNSAIFRYLYEPELAAQSVPISNSDETIRHCTELILAYAESGAFKELDSITTAHAAETSSLAAAAPWGLSIDTRRLQSLGYVNAARMALAQQRGDPSEWLLAFESNLTMSRLAAGHPTLFGIGLAATIDAETFGRLRSMSASQPGEVWSRSVLGILDRRRSPRSRAAAAAGQIAECRPFIASVFGDASNVRFGVWSVSRMQDAAWVNGFSGGLGTYDQNLDALAAFGRVWESHVTAQPFERSSLPPITVTPYRIVNASTAWFSSFLDVIDRQTVHTTSMPLIAAAELRRALAGRFPDSLDDLSPHWPHGAIDPYSGKPLIYRVDPDGLGYTLYSLGHNQTDEGGAFPPDPPAAGWSPGVSSAPDVVITRHRPPAVDPSR